MASRLRVGSSRRSTAGWCINVRARLRRADLTVEGLNEPELLGENGGPLPGCCTGQMIQPAEEFQIFLASQPRIKAMIRSCVVAEPAADLLRLPDRIKPCDTRRSARRQEQRRQDSQERGLAGAIRAEERKCFPLPYFQRDSSQSHSGGLLERL